MFERAEALYQDLLDRGAVPVMEAIIQRLPGDRKPLRRLKVAHSGDAFSLAFNCEFANYFLAKSEYETAHLWALEALQLLFRTHCERAQHRLRKQRACGARTVVEVFRTVGKVMIAKRNFESARILIGEAVAVARQELGEETVVHAQCLEDKASLELSLDQVGNSIASSRQALRIYERLFPDLNLRVAICRENLAYSTYVYDYRHGDFSEALELASSSLALMRFLLPKDHLLLGGSQRVLALILEEVASDENNDTAAYMQEVEAMHLNSLALSVRAFGEDSFPTAKIFGNLGRLYQATNRFRRAEEMHLKAIATKTKLFGEDDYRVAISMGHLASLYAYNLEEPAKAELLYLKSIDIVTRAFGGAFSGLQYDYEGLIQVYRLQRDRGKVEAFRRKLDEWTALRSNLHEDGDQRTTTADEDGPLCKNVDGCLVCEAAARALKAMK